LYSNIQYDTIAGVNPNLLSLDVYKPINYTGFRPVVIYIHGGYWNAGDKTNVYYLPGLFTDSGYVFVSINYRLSPNPIDTISPTSVRFPIHPQDCANAIKWVFNNIQNYSGDTSRAGLMGFSAGAHLVLIVSTNEIFLQNTYLSLKGIKGTCSLDCGVFDLPEELRQAGGYIQRRAPLINAFGRDTSLYDDASPQFNIQQGKSLPNFLLVHQNTPDRVYSNVRFKDSLIANGYSKVTLFNAYPYDHGQIALMLGNPMDTIGETDTVMAFFRRCLSGTITGIIDNSNTIPSDYILYQNYPNPFNPITKIKFDIPKSEQVNLKIYDLLGKEISTLVNENLKKGIYEVDFNGKDLPSGIYFYQLKAGSFIEKKNDGYEMIKTS
jgi:hypothetical protein